jgi:hypothetical protein
MKNLKENKMKKDVSEVTKKLVKVRVRVSSWNGNVKNNTGKIELATNHDADKDALNVGVSMLPKTIQKSIRDFANGIRNEVKARSLPFQDGGYRIIPAKNYPELNRVIQEKIENFRSYVNDEIIMKYDEIKEYTKRRLGSLYSESDFPDVNELVNRYGACLFIEPIADLDDIRIDGIDAGELKKIKDNTLAEYEDNLIKGQMDLVNKLKDAVKTILDKTESEKSRYKRALEKLGEICDVVPELNIFGSETLDNLAKDIKTKIAGQNSDALATSKVVQKKVVTASKDIISQLNNLTF